MKPIAKAFIGILSFLMLFAHSSCNRNNEILLIASSTFNEVRFYKNSMEFELIKDDIRTNGKYEWKNDTFFLTYNEHNSYTESRGCFRNAGNENDFLTRRLVINKPGVIESADNKPFSAQMIENHTGVGCTRKMKLLSSSSLINIPSEADWKDSIKNCFSKYVKKEKINKEIIQTNQASERYTTYLGEIKDTNGETLYDVISQFYTIQAAITRHGHSCIIFLNENKETVKLYDVAMPEDLPVQLQNNELFFKHAGQLNSISLMEPLPKLLCIPEVGCSENLF